MSADEITTYWSSYDNTDFNPTITQLPNTNTSDGSTVEKRTWENGDNCVAVSELKVIGGGHDWPGSSGNMDIDATSEIWNFVSKFDINGLINCSSSDIIDEVKIEPDRLIKIIDVLGRETNLKNNQPLFFIYENGKIEKKYFSKPIF